MPIESKDWMHHHRDNRSSVLSNAAKNTSTTRWDAAAGMDPRAVSRGITTCTGCGIAVTGMLGFIDESSVKVAVHMTSQKCWSARLA